MAGIIGNMTAQKRLRRERKEILSNKCVYQLKPFSTFGFKPELHNTYVAACHRKRMKEENNEKETEMSKHDNKVTDKEVGGVILEPDLLRGDSLSRIHVFTQSLSQTLSPFWRIVNPNFVMMQRKKLWFRKLPHMVHYGLVLSQNSAWSRSHMVP